MNNTAINIGVDQKVLFLVYVPFWSFWDHDLLLLLLLILLLLLLLLWAKAV